MNILYLHRTQGQGVEGVHIWGIANGFMKLGHGVSVVSPSGIHDRQPERPENKKDTSSNKSVLGLLSKYTPELIFEFVEMAYNYISGKQIKKASNAFKPDIIYERYAIFAVAGMRFAKKNNIPLIIEVNYTSCSPLVRKRSALLKPFAKYIDRKLFECAASIVVVSSFLRDHLINDYGISPDKILVCTNAADPDVFTENTQGVSTLDGVSLKDKKVIGFVGTFSPWHGVHMLIDAFKAFSHDVSDAVIALVGDGPEKESIRQKVIEYKLEDRVFFVGTVMHDNLPKYVAAFSIGVMPDSNEYGSPMKIFEYMAMGKPVVVPDYAPLLDAVENGKQGVIFERKNTSSLAHCMKTLLQDQENLALMGHHARSHIVNKHNWLANAEKTLLFFNALVKQRVTEVER